MDDGSAAELGVEEKLSVEPSISSSSGAGRTPEELVAKAIAPVKRGFLRPPPTRPHSADADGGVSDAKAAASVIIKEKKSKRQLKRERRQEQKSVLHICPEIAKTGNIGSCPYNDKCRFSHDLEAFKTQKPADLEGNCPFMSAEVACPYGLACRFSGTHKDDICNGALNGQKISSEMNGLSKDVQKLLWKNKLNFPKANAKLKLLGLMGKANSKVKMEDKEEGDQTISNGSHDVDENARNEAANDLSDDVELAPKKPEDNEDGAFVADEIRPLKKAKSVGDEKCCTDELNNDSCVSVECKGANMMQKDTEQSSRRNELEAKMDNIITDADMCLKLHSREKKLIDFREKLYLAPLTTVGNLPFRRICKVLGADVTCGEMAMCTNLLQGQASEWALLRRHSLEDLFGVQICGAHPDTVARTVELIDQECTVDFIDINMGCPIDIVVNKGAGSALLMKPLRMKNVIRAASGTVDQPITVKVRTGYFEGRNRIDSFISDIRSWGATAVTIHGRSRQQRYSKLADWDYIYDCARKAPDSLPVLGNGDVFSYLEWNKHKSDCPELSSCMIARGALVKPWIFTEIKEQRHWDISSGERLNILKDYVRFGLEHWGSDTKGVETTRHFLLEWLSYTYRYIPVGLLDVIPQRLNWRPPSYFGRDDLETLMASDSAADWIRISEMLLGKVPSGFTFAPKHKSNAYDRAENG
ncbi:tRNA-dihydrouridine(47) synthase [NAD(P)(+)]-like [Malania oleifera]|uniref:tRNA-dihydrouridine(47) synthase [NAD(P)(+)]-like n=1 Tax=Malania oleifera TaxID=397392 RepID=UPI0025AECA05|nr:tRNA-dihydrouridine(47) synthase [NAD(P)(+)]-like [Malania oleifera]